MVCGSGSFHIFWWLGERKYDICGFCDYAMLWLQCVYDVVCAVQICFCPQSFSMSMPNVLGKFFNMCPNALLRSTSLIVKYVKITAPYIIRFLLVIHHENQWKFVDLVIDFSPSVSNEKQVKSMWTSQLARQCPPQVSQSSNLFVHVHCYDNSKFSLRIPHLRSKTYFVQYILS